MGISRIKICNFKSIKRVEAELTDGRIHCLLGKNGAGKSTIINAIEYFYAVSQSQSAIKNVIDKKNPYIQKAIIEITFDFRYLMQKARNEYIDSTLMEIEKYMLGNELSIRLTQFKNGTVEWYPFKNNYIVKKILKIFPIFAINVREVSLKDWSYLWEIISDIGISETKKNSRDIRDELGNIFSEIYGEKYSKTLEIIERVLGDENVSLNENDYKKRFKNALLTNLNGEIFKYDNNDINFYSTGVNSLKYISLYVRLINALIETSWKEALIIADEPENSLHPQFVEELAEVFAGENKIDFLIVTHSAHFISSLLKTERRVAFLQVYMDEQYTYLGKVKDVFAKMDKYLMSDNEANAYFANGLVFVEGPTEVQVFSNIYLARLFPVLKKITIYNTQSNDTSTKLIIPTKNKMQVPFLVVLDMDKVITFSNKKMWFREKVGNKVVNPFGNEDVERTERYYYCSQRKIKLCKLKKQILNDLRKKDKYCANDISIVDKEYYTMISSVKRYCEAYNVILFRTTIEGAIICDESFDIFMNWLRLRWGENTYNQYISEIQVFSRVDQISITRCVFHGKFDNLLNDGEGKKINMNSNLNKLINTYKTGSKTDGWVVDFLRWVIEDVLIGEVSEKRKLFKKTFPEIASVVKYIENMVD